VYAVSGLALSLSLYHSGQTLAVRLSAVLSQGKNISGKVRSTQVQALASVSALSFLAKAALPCLLLVFDVSSLQWSWVAFMLCYYGLVELLPTAYILLSLRASARERVHESEYLSADSNAQLEEELSVPLKILTFKA